MSDNNDFKYEIKEDILSFGDGKWQKHLTYISWNGAEPVYDLRQWNPDMTKCGKGITLSKDDLFDLMSAFEDILSGSSEE